MILSVSRRTDIPAYHTEWFLNRIKEGFVDVRNPYNKTQVTRISLNPNVIDCIVFWTKNPKPLTNRIDELKDYNYYFQFTLTGYGNNIEKNIPNKRNVMIPEFIRLSEKIGKEKVIWRYDPILLSDVYTLEYHIKAFSEIAKALKGYTNKCVISFIDIYTQMQPCLQELNIRALNTNEMTYIAKKFVEIAKENDMVIETCAEKIDLDELGIKHGHCIDKETIEQIIGKQIVVGKDKNQRAECGCMASIDIGTYNTCKNGCVYCYATTNPAQIPDIKNYNRKSSLLCDELTPDDVIKEKKMESLVDNQIKFSFD